MKISGKRDYLLSLESVAMTDIVLNMFIFFFISFSLLYTFNPFIAKKIDIKLPKASNTQATAREIKFTVTITAEGMVYLNERLLTPKELEDQIRSSEKDTNRLSVAIRADKFADFGSVIEVLDILKNLEITPVSIAVLDLDELKK